MRIYFIETISCSPRFYAGHDQLLSKLKPAEIDENYRQKCLPNTRLEVIDFIIRWIADESSDSKQVLWLHGLAGSGKSTLATTIAWMMRELRRLGGFFFFDRDVPERSAAMLVRTLAHRLSLLDDRIGAAIARIVASNQTIAEMPLTFQFANMLSASALESVEWSGGPVLLVIDAVDECPDRGILMQALSQGFSNLPSFIRILAVSRRERDIQQTLGSHSHVLQYSLDIDSAGNKEDISEFLRHRLDEIRMNDGFLDARWPGDDKIGALVLGAGGLFVWASTACLYIEGHDPDQRLSELIEKQPESHLTGPFVQLDRLYMTGLQSAGSWSDPSFSSDCCSILGMILCARIPLSDSTINTLLGLPKNRPCRKSISHLGCVLRISETEGIRILHPSFHDYLSERCNSKPWYINLQSHHKKLALHCIKLLDKMLCENICGLTLPESVKEKSLPSAVSYACKFWIEHICFISNITDDILGQIYQFLREHLLHWMEVLAILKCHDLTIQLLKNLFGWIQASYLVFLQEA